MARRKKRAAVWSARRRFQAFIDRAKELNETRLVRERTEVSYQITPPSAGGELIVTSPEFDQDSLRSLLSIIRPFVMNSEPIFISKIMNEAVRYSTDSELSDKISHAKDQWSRVYHKRGYFPMQIDNLELTAEMAMDLLFNSKYFHTDPVKIDLMERLGKLPIPMVEMQLRLSLPNLTNVILFMSNVLRLGLERGAFLFPDE